MCNSKTTLFSFCCFRSSFLLSCLWRLWQSHYTGSGWTSLWQAGLAVLTTFVLSQKRKTSWLLFSLSMTTNSLRPFEGRPLVLFNMVNALFPLLTRHYNMYCNADTLCLLHIQISPQNLFSDLVVWSKSVITSGIVRFEEGETVFNSESSSSYLCT